MAAMQHTTEEAIAPPPSSPIPGLTRRRKAALIVQMLLSDGNALSLAHLPEHVQERLARELGAIRLVDRDTVQAVATEFADLLESIGLSAPGGAAAALDALSDHISPALARKLRARLEAQNGIDPWTRLLDLDDDVLTDVMQAETVEVSAVLMSKLPVGRAAKLLAAMPGEQARRITIAVSRTDAVRPEAVDRIGRGLMADYCKPNLSAFEKAPVDRLGAILNSGTAALREDLLTGLDDADASFARSVRKAIFTFPDIPARLKPIDIAACLRSVEPADLTTAIAYAGAQGGPTGDAAEFILANITQRMAGQIREEAAERGRIKPEEGEAALNAVTSAIRALADDGTIILIDPEDEDDAAA